MEKENRILPRLLEELKLAKTIGCMASVKNDELFELIELLEKENYWRNQYDFHIESATRFQLTADKYWEQSKRLKEICKNLIYSIDGEFVSQQLSNQAESAEEELQLMELNK